jgi:hypothetical protein
LPLAADYAPNGLARKLCDGEPSASADLSCFDRIIVINRKLAQALVKL